jgi:pimeloyl-ACP methyl ester carboxylesterase
VRGGHAVRRLGPVALVVAALWLPAGAQADVLGYCKPSSTLLNPLDVPPGGSAPVVVPGVTTRTATLSGVQTRLLEAGDPSSDTAVVFLGPGTGADWAGLMSEIGAGGTRAVAFDLPGYGHTAPAWDAQQIPGAAADYIGGALDQLGIRKVHLVAHDVGGPYGLEWAVRHPDRLRSAVVIDTGFLLGYKHHQLAQISRIPELGELFWLQMTRLSSTAGLQLGQSPTRPLPAEYVNRVYDDLDRETRCAIIRTYRAKDEPEINAFAERQAEVLRADPSRPALVIWGARDPYLPTAMAYRQREGFPSARVEVFPESGHWPFADDPDRTRALVVPFLLNAVASDNRSPAG